MPPVAMGLVSQHRAKPILIILFLISCYLFLSPVSLRFPLGPIPRSSILQQGRWHWRWHPQTYTEASGPLKKHPIQTLVENAERHFEKKLKRQSKTFEDAVKKYKRLHRREPPPGFDKLYEYAVKINSSIIDDFGAIRDSLEPFWALPAHEIVKRARAVVKSKKWLDIYTIKNHTIDQNGPIHDWIETFVAEMPDMLIPYNHLAESRVVHPFDNQTSDNNKLLFCGPQRNISSLGEVYRFQNISHAPTWVYVITSCQPGSLARTTRNIFTNQTSNLKFTKDVIASKDLCENPDHRRLHGNLISPDSTLLAQDLVPVFSRNKMSTFQDILVPTPAYRNRALLSSNLVPWEAKHNDLYWTGTTTGGYSRDGSWQFTQRFRFVSMMNNPNRTIQLLQKVGDRWETHRSTVKSISNLVTAKFTKQALCTPHDCEAQRNASTIRFGKRDPPTEYQNHTLVIDIDGQASTDRYYKLLSSGSAVLKQTLMREWHDDRLIPWLHYVPVSLGMEELPEIVRYLTEEDEGRLIARKIADQGREWWLRALRNEDMALYMYRLLLEWARLIDPKRDEGRSACE